MFISYVGSCFHCRRNAPRAGGLRERFLRNYKIFFVRIYLLKLFFVLLMLDDARALSVARCSTMEWLSHLLGASLLVELAVKAVVDGRFFFSYYVLLGLYLYSTCLAALPIWTRQRVSHVLVLDRYIFSSWKLLHPAHHTAFLGDEIRLLNSYILRWGSFGRFVVEILLLSLSLLVYHCCCCNSWWLEDASAAALFHILIAQVSSRRSLL